MSEPRAVTPAEFQILEVLWRSSRPLSVAEVLEQLNRRRQLAYTTVMTLLDKLARKGSVQRTKRGRAYWYRPAVVRREVLEFLIQSFAASYLGGEPNRLLALLKGERAHGRIRKQVQSPAGAPPAGKSSSGPDIDVTLL